MDGCLNATAHLPSIHVRQVYIQKYEVRLIGDKPPNSFLPRGCLDYTVSRILENAGTNSGLLHYHQHSELC
jgi:hypothetical protein